LKVERIIRISSSTYEFMPTTTRDMLYNRWFLAAYKSSRLAYVVLLFFQL